MLKWKETRIALNNYKKYVVSQSRRNLSINKMGRSSLYKSLRGVVNNQRDRLGRFKSGAPQLTFYMNDYGKFVDEGVRGTKDKDANAFAKPNKFNPRKSMIDLGAVKRMVLKNGATGDFTKGKQKSMLFAIAKSIHQKGIKRSLFFTKPFKKRQNRAFDQIHEGSANDITNHIVQLIKTKWLQK